MTRRDIESSYTVDANGIIRSPGKFEGEPVYVPYFWDAYLEGFADEDDGEVLTFRVTAEDRAEFPELDGVTTVRLWETDQGFVYSETDGRKASWRS